MLFRANPRGGVVSVKELLSFLKRQSEKFADVAGGYLSLRKLEKDVSLKQLARTGGLVRRELARELIGYLDVNNHLLTSIGAVYQVLRADSRGLRTQLGDWRRRKPEESPTFKANY
jgi:hypothetical protein